MPQPAEVFSAAFSGQTEPMTHHHYRSSEDRRADMAAQASALGIDAAYIDTLVDTFYARVREDAVLGPIFDEAIEDWAPHLAQMKRFWRSVALGLPVYEGRPVPAHLKHGDKIKAEDFAHWLALFEQTLKDTAPSPDAVAFFMERAQRIAKSLQLALFAIPGLKDGPASRSAGP